MRWAWKAEARIASEFKPCKRRTQNTKFRHYLCAIYNSPNLTRGELALLSALDRRGQTRFTVQEAKTILGRRAGGVIAAMARKGVLDRIGRGVYVVRPLRAVGRPWSLSVLAAVEQALQSKPHYIGGLAALSLHRLTEQLYGSVVDVFLTQRRAQQTLSNARLRFHKVPATEIDVGVAVVTIDDVPVQISDPEKTLVDALNHPSAFGGIAPGLGAIAQGLDKIDVDQLVTYALALSHTSGLQRLGVLLERHHAPEDQVERIAAKVGNTRNLPAMIPGPRTGPFNSKWRISENDQVRDGHRPTTTT